MEKMESGKYLKKNQVRLLSSLKSTWFFMNTDSRDGYFNMSCDNFLLEELVVPILRVYAWDKPTVTIGVNQSLKNIDKTFSSYPVVRRLTGGQAVLHGTKENELTYSIVLPLVNNIKSVRKIYFEIGEILLSFLNSYGLNGNFGYLDKTYLNDFNCFNSKTSADIVVSGIKVIGSAQCRKRKGILQHGSVKLDKIRELLGEKNKISFNTAVNNVKTAFENMLGIRFIDYPLKDLRR